MTNLAPLLAAMIAVESGGDCRAIGDGGRARGVLQIHPGVVQDVNRVYGTTYRHADMHNPHVARDVAVAYLRHYCGTNATPERMARVWHCGPSGWRRKAGAVYWRKVQQNFERKPVSSGIVPRATGKSSGRLSGSESDRGSCSASLMASGVSVPPSHSAFPRRQPVSSGLDGIVSARRRGI